MRCVAGGDELVCPANGLKLLQSFQRGRWTVAFVGAERDFLFRYLAGVAVLDSHDSGKRYDLITVAACLLCCGCALLRSQCVFILGKAADSVARCDDIGCIDHRQIDFRFVFKDPRACRHMGIGMSLGQRNGFQTARQHGRRPLDGDGMGGQSNGLETGGAEPVDSQTRRGHREAGADGDLSGNIAAGRPLRQAASEDGVLDQVGVNAGTFHSGAGGSTAKFCTMGYVQTASKGFGDRGTGGRYDYSFTHGVNIL